MSKRAKVLFIIHDVYQDDNHFPLGPGYLAAVLKQNKVDVQVYCQDVFHYSNEELVAFLEDNEFDIIGVGFLAARFKETIKPLCQVINKHKKKAWLVLGGHCPSAIPDYILKATQADVVVIGEGEETLLELVNCKVKKGNLAKIKGIAYPNKGRVKVNERRIPARNLDSLPFPEWSLFPMKEYTTCLRPFGFDPEEVVTMDIITSRGCSSRCNFCYRMEKGLRIRSIPKVVEEMALLNKRYRVDYFYLDDELFVFSKKRLLEFKESLKRNKLKINFFCAARVDVFDKEMAILLKECGCDIVSFGMESMDQKVLDLMNKRTTVEQNIKVAQIARGVGLGLGLNLIWGNLGDSAESLKKNVEYIKKYNAYKQIRTIRPVTPYPGCDLYYEAIRRGLLKGPEDFFKKFKNSDLFTVNFTNLPDEKYYQLLFEANKELIIDHYLHTTKDMESANKLINDFYNLYFKGFAKFRGARHYSKRECFRERCLYKK